MTDAAIEALYRETYSDLTIDADERASLVESFSSLRPPADKLVWLRASAFRVACEFLSEDDRDTNVSLLRAICAVVHALETTCMLPGLEEEGGGDFSDEGVEELYRSVYDSGEGAGEDGDDDGPPVIDADESAAIHSFFSEDATRPPLGRLVWMRSTAFRIGSEFLNEDNDRAANVSLFRSINVVVHSLELTCMKPKPFVLELDEGIEPSEETSFEEAVQSMWNLDANRLTPGVDYRMNVQEGKKPYYKEDVSDDPLFTFVNRTVYKSRPTFRAFVALLDNYSAEVGEDEVVTRQEKGEIMAFLKAVMQTAPMQYCHKYCHLKDPDNVPEDPEKFIYLLRKIWFNLYSRSRGEAEDSCGFEHVFVGEIKNGSVSGFHNWIMFYLEEQRGNVDYRGYIKPKGRSCHDMTNNDDHVLTLQFHWKGREKFVGTSFVGVSPEFELAIYTAAFFVGEGEENVFMLDAGPDVFELKLKCYKYDRDTKIGTSFVEALSHYENEE